MYSFLAFLVGQREQRGRKHLTRLPVCSFQLNGNSRQTHMSLCGSGLTESFRRPASITSLNLELPMLTANCRETRDSQEIQDRSTSSGIEGKVRCADYQELRGAQEIQSERLDPGVVDAKLSVDARTLYAGQDAQIGGKPCWI